MALRLEPPGYLLKRELAAWQGPPPAMARQLPGGAECVPQGPSESEVRRGAARRETPIRPRPTRCARRSDRPKHRTVALRQVGLMTVATDPESNAEFGTGPPIPVSGWFMEATAKHSLEGAIF